MMTSKSDSTPFSISFLMKPDECGHVTPPSLTPPPCFLDGSLTSLLSQDITRLPDISHLQENGKEDDSYSESAISPPPTPISSEAEPSPDQRSSLPLQAKPTLTYTDLSLSTLPPVPPRPPFPLDFLLGSSQHQLPHHHQHQQQHPHVIQHKNLLQNEQQVRQHHHQSQDVKQSEHSNTTSRQPDTSLKGNDENHVPVKKSRVPISRTQTAKTESATSPDDNGSRGKRNRINFTANQLRKLEKVFQTTPYPEPHLYESLADELSLKPKNLKTWFQNKRARNKKQKLQEAGVNSNCKPEVLPYMAPFPTSMSSALPQYTYNMTSGLMPPPTHSSTLITPPPSPQMIKHPLNLFPPHNMSVRASSVSPPPMHPYLTSPDARTAKYHISPPVPRTMSPVLPTPDIRGSGHYPQPGQTTPRFVHPSFPYPGFYHDRLSHAEYRDLHEPVHQETPHVYPSMLSALEKLCSSLPL